MTVLLLLLGTIFVCTWFLLKWKHSYWTRKGIQQMKPDLFFGNFTDAIFKRQIPNEIILKAYNHFKSAGAKYGGVYFIYSPIFIVVDQNLMKQIFYKDFGYFTGHGNFYKHKGDILSNNLFNIEGEEWKNLRSKLTPAFSSGKLKLMFDILNSVGDRLESKVENSCQKGEPLEIKELAACFGTDVIASCAFGLECNTLENPDDDFRKYGQMIFEPRLFYQVIESTFNWDLLNFFGHTWLKKDANTFFLRLVKDMIDYREKNNITRYDFLHLLLQLGKKENVKNGDDKNILSFENIAANVFSIYAAGFETTSTAVSFIMFELARNPAIQEKVRQEILKICKTRPNHQIGYDDLKEMKYCDMVINESLRLHSVATDIPRKCTSDYKIPGTNIIIDKGTLVLLPAWSVHKDSDNYSNPEKFNPENFSEERKEARNDFSFFPFGEGPRLCIGYRFAIIEIKVALVKYLRNYKYELNPKTPREMTYEANNVTMVPKGDILLDVSRLT